MAFEGDKGGEVAPPAPVQIVRRGGGGGIMRKLVRSTRVHKKDDSAPRLFSLKTFHNNGRDVAGWGRHGRRKKTGLKGERGASP